MIVIIHFAIKHANTLRLITESVKKTVMIVNVIMMGMIVLISVILDVYKV